ncbi:serine hydrolase domain-containing protein [Colwelliaceae bacterium BS250]
MHKTHSPLIVLTVLLFQFSCHANANVDSNKIDENLLPKVQVVGKSYKPKTIEQRMAHYKVPGISIAVVKDGHVAWVKAYGIANSKTKQLVTKDTLFQAGSISKPIAALAALKLVEDNKVNLDDDVNDYLTSWKIPKSTFTEQQPVTLRHLLTHTAGTTVHGFPGYKQGQQLPSDADVLNGKGNTPKVTVDKQPGSAWRYSGGGYTVMEQLVADVTKLPFDKYLNDAVLKPLKMNHSTFEQPLAKSKWSLASAAFDQHGEQIEGDWNNYPEQAAAGLWTTPSDLAKYMIAVQSARKEQAHSALNSDIVNQMLTVHLGDWGLGPTLAMHDQGLVFSHGGKNAGFTNDFLAYADSGNGIVIMANGDNAGALIDELKVAISKRNGWDLATAILLEPASLSPALKSKISGTYNFDRDPDYKVSIVIDGGQIEVHDHARDQKIQFIATSENIITNLTSGSEVEFNTDSDGKLVGLTWSGSYKFIKVAE